MTTFELGIDLVANRPPLTLNQRLNRYEHGRRVANLRFTTGWRAKAAKIGAHEHVTVRLHYATGCRRGCDADNLVATQKPAVDGLVDAKVIPDDDPAHLTWWAPQVHTGPGVRRMWLEVWV